MRKLLTILNAIIRTGKTGMILFIALDSKDSCSPPLGRRKSLSGFYACSIILAGFTAGAPRSTASSAWARLAAGQAGNVARLIERRGNSLIMPRCAASWPEIWKIQFDHHLNRLRENSWDSLPTSVS
jgi:hypothetical protein